jgi:hypothetical protein
MCTHTNTQTYIDTDRRSYAHKHTHTRTRAHVQIQSLTRHSHTCTRTHTSRTLTQFHAHLFSPCGRQALQGEIRRGRRCSLELCFVSDLVIADEIGRGGFGTVYSGSWRHSPAAIKVCCVILVEPLAEATRARRQTTPASAAASVHRSQQPAISGPSPSCARDADGRMPQRYA